MLFRMPEYKIQNSKFKILLRAIEPSDVDFMYDVEQDPDAWKYSDYVAPLSHELLRQYALTYDADPLRAGQLRLIIEDGGIPVGIADIFDISARHLRADTGIYILPQYRYSGKGAAALKVLADYCKDRLGLHQIVASVSKHNQPALRCYIKAEFVETGMRPQWWRSSQGYEDVALLMLNLES